MPIHFNPPSDAGFINLKISGNGLYRPLLHITITNFYCNNMALAEVCGINSYSNFNKTRDNEKLTNDIDRYSENFRNNVRLAVPPFINVGKL